jgi:hypothetical protein
MLTGSKPGALAAVVAKWAWAKNPAADSVSGPFQI